MIKSCNTIKTDRQLTLLGPQKPILEYLRTANESRFNK